MFSVISKSQLKKLAKLRQKKYRDRFGWYMVSGAKAVSGALYSKKVDPVIILCTAENQKICGKIQNQHHHISSLECYLLSNEEFSSISDEKNPQGIAVILRKPDAATELPHKPKGTLIYLDRVSDPGNLGTIIRTALWFGVDTLLLSPNSADPYQPKSVRASAGTISQMHFVENCTREKLMDLKSNNNYRCIASMADGATALQDLDKNEKNLILFGAEASGLNRDLLEISDTRVRITGSGKAESLNLSVSVACFLYQLQT